MHEGRGDLRAYENGALELRNLFIFPTGGVTRRAGPIPYAIAYVTLDRADKMNSLDLPMLRALASVPVQLAKDRSIRVVILRGDGRAFCTGLDFAGAKLQGLSAVRNFGKFPGQKTNLFQQACWAWRELPVPVIAAVHGHCYGGGLQVALALHLFVIACAVSSGAIAWLFPAGEAPKPTAAPQSGLQSAPSAAPEARPRSSAE